MKNIKYNILEQIITEGRLEDMIKKYEGKVSEDVVRQLSAADPSGNNKYLDWMCDQRITYTSEYIIKTVQCFHENVNRLSEKNVNAIFTNFIIPKIKKAPKDINSYPTPDSIDLICKYFEEQKPKTASRVKIYEDDKWLVVSPLTHQASCQYGAHSNWCVSTSNEDYYKRYTKEGILVFFLDKKGMNPTKPEANIYKVAVNIRFDRPDPIQWEWYSMEDTKTDAALMLNLMPKNLITATEKYLKEFTEELFKKFQIDEKYLADNSMALYKEGSKYYIFLPFDSWSKDSITSKVQFLSQYSDLNDIVNEVEGDKQNGLPYITLSTSVNKRPEVNVDYISWNPATSNRRADNTISFKQTLEHMYQRYSSINRYIKSVIEKLDETSRKKILDTYMVMFNEAKISRNENVAATNLNVGDVILDTGARRWGSGPPVTVTRVAEKSIQLSNGKRIARTYSNYKKRVTGIMKIVDDRQQPEETQTIPESRWIRKRII